jgi:hypothetical protein
MRTPKTKRNRTTATAKTEGARLRDWIEANFETAGCEPLVETLCHLSDRLAAVRATQMKGVDCRLVNAETKLVSQFNMTWRLAGFADPDIPTKRSHPIGGPMQRSR